MLLCPGLAVPCPGVVEERISASEAATTSEKKDLYPGSIEDHALVGAHRRSSAGRYI